MLRTVLLAPWLAVLLAGCVQDDDWQEGVLRDTTGESFSFGCRDGCWVEQLSADLPDPPCPADEDPGYSFYLGRFVIVTGACFNEEGWWSSDSYRDRPVECVASEECPSLLGETFECRAGLCQNADLEAWPIEAIFADQVEYLCLAGIPRSKTMDLATGWEAIEWVSDRVDEACGPDAEPATICSLPLPVDCAQPL